MTFESILFANAAHRPEEEPSRAPDFFVDLNLDQIVDTVTAGRQRYDLKPFFYTPLQTSYGEDLYRKIIETAN